MPEKYLGRDVSIGTKALEREWRRIWLHAACSNYMPVVAYVLFTARSSLVRRSCHRAKVLDCAFASSDPQGFPGPKSKHPRIKKRFGYKTYQRPDVETPNVIPSAHRLSDAINMSSLLSYHDNYQLSLSWGKMTTWFTYCNCRFLTCTLVSQRFYPCQWLTNNGWQPIIYDEITHVLYVVMVINENNNWATMGYSCCMFLLSTTA